MTSPAGPTTRPSAWEPLRSPVFRALWLALLASNIGTWMQTVGAQWLLVDAPNAATLVSLVQTASSLPVLLLALPAGALADSFDRRRILIVVQLGLVAVGTALTVFEALGRLPSGALLALTFGLGVGQALTLPAWQAVIPELVTRPNLPSAAALGAISMNLARAVGPAIAGLLIAQAGVTVVFALNTISFAVFAVVLWRWHRPRDQDGPEPEHFAAAVRAGGRFMRHSPVMRVVLIRVAWFVVPGSAPWALLPLDASARLGLGAGGYGLLLGAIGVGAVLGALVLPRLRDRFSPNVSLAVASLAYGAALLVLALVPSFWPVMLVLVLAGVAWVAVLSNMNAAMQLFLPAWVRARGLAIYQIVLFGGLGLGSLAWGALAEVTTLPVAHVTAAAVMALGVASLRFWALRDVSELDRSPSRRPEPELTYAPDPDDGPVLVTIRYSVPAENEERFVEAMQFVRRVRQRTGAVQWGLFREGEVDRSLVEVYLVPSWDEHLRQHGGRLTGHDQGLVDQARAFSDGEPEVRHLLPARP